LKKVIEEKKKEPETQSEAVAAPIEFELAKAAEQDTRL
jgi:hypothetical protein